MWIEWAQPQAKQAQGSAHGFVDTCLHEKRKAIAVEAVPPDRLAMWQGWPVATW
jgi:hypothetical protein